jgi:hypothetical protein
VDNDFLFHGQLSLTGKNRFKGSAGAKDVPMVRLVPLVRLGSSFTCRILSKLMLIRSDWLWKKGEQGCCRNSSHRQSSL